MDDFHISGSGSWRRTKLDGETIAVKKKKITVLSRVRGRWVRQSRPVGSLQRFLADGRILGLGLKIRLT